MTAQELAEALDAMGRDFLSAAKACWLNRGMPIAKEVQPLLAEIREHVQAIAKLLRDATRAS